MLILPFIHKHTATISIFQFLVIGRCTLWSEEDGLSLDDILHPNGIYLSGPPIPLGNTLLCPVDAQNTNVSDFYRWEENATPDEPSFSWKTVYVPNGLRIPTEQIGPHTYTEIIQAIGHLNV